MLRVRNNITRRSFLLLVCTCCSLGCMSGCQRPNTAKEKINKTIEQLEAHAPGSLALDALRKATEESLKEPHLVFARLVEQRETVVMLVEWVEAMPTADTICLSYPQDKKWQTYPIDDDDKEQELEESKQGYVLFNATLSWDPAGRTWAGMRKRIRNNGCQVQLSRNGKVVSNVVSLKYIKGPTLSGDLAK